LIGVRYSKVNYRISQNSEVFCIVLFPSTFDIQLVGVRYSKIKDEPQNSEPLIGDF